MAELPEIHEIAVQVGLETTMSDPVLVRRGARVGAMLRPVPWAGAGLWLGAYPALGERDWTAATRDLIVNNDAEVVPNLSRVVARGDVGVEVSPLRAATERATTALRLLATLGVSHTVDDMSYVPDQDEPDSTGEWSPTLGWGAAVDTWRGPLGVQIRCAQTLHNEIAWDGRAQWKRPLWVGVDVGLRLSRDRE